MPVVWRLSGAVTETGLTISCKTTGATSVRVALSTSEALTDPVYSTAAAPGAHGQSKHVFTGLTPATRYWYAVEMDAVLDAVNDPGTVRTAGADTFRFAAAGCADTGSNHAVFAAIAAEEPDGFFQLGDAHYADSTSSNAATWAGYYDAWLSASNPAALWSSCWLSYSGSDHDTGPDNNYLGMTRGYDMWAETYRRYLPHHPLALGSGAPYRTWLLHDRIRVVATDTRAFRSDPAAVDDAAKTMLGATQKQWLKDTWLAAKAAGEVILWPQEVPWQGDAGSGTDSWKSYATERAELAAFITANDLSGRIYMIASDMHAVGYVRGQDNQQGGFPIAYCGPLDQDSGTFPDPSFTVGPFPAAPDNAGSTHFHQYGVFDVAVGPDAVSITYTAKDSTGAVLIPAQTASLPPAEPEMQLALLADLAALPEPGSVIHIGEEPPTDPDVILWATPGALEDVASETPFMADTFPSPDGTLVLNTAAEVGESGAWSTLLINANGTDSAVNMEINTGRARSQTNSTCRAVRNATEPPSADYAVEMDAIVTDLSSGTWAVIARCSTTGTSNAQTKFYAAGIAGGTTPAYFINRKDEGGAAVRLATAVTAPTTGNKTIRFVCTDDYKRLYVNGVLVCEDTADNTITQVGRAGFDAPGNLRGSIDAVRAYEVSTWAVAEVRVRA